MKGNIINPGKRLSWYWADLAIQYRVLLLSSWFLEGITEVLSYRTIQCCIPDESAEEPFLPSDFPYFP